MKYGKEKYQERERSEILRDKTGDWSDWYGSYVIQPIRAQIDFHQHITDKIRDLKGQDNGQQIGVHPKKGKKEQKRS